MFHNPQSKQAEFHPTSDLKPVWEASADFYLFVISLLS